MLNGLRYELRTALVDLRNAAKPKEVLPGDGPVSCGRELAGPVRLIHAARVFTRAVGWFRDPREQLERWAQQGIDDEEWATANGRKSLADTSLQQGALLLRRISDVPRDELRQIIASVEQPAQDPAIVEPCGSDSSLIPMLFWGVDGVNTGELILKAAGELAAIVLNRTECVCGSRFDCLQYIVRRIYLVRDVLRDVSGNSISSEQTRNIPHLFRVLRDQMVCSETTIAPLLEQIGYHGQPDNERFRVGLVSANSASETLLRLGDHVISNLREELGSGVSVTPVKARRLLKTINNVLGPDEPPTERADMAGPVSARVRVVMESAQDELRVIQIEDSKPTLTDILRQFRALIKDRVSRERDTFESLSPSRQQSDSRAQTDEEMSRQRQHSEHPEKIRSEGFYTEWSRCIEQTARELESLGNNRSKTYAERLRNVSPALPVLPGDNNIDATPYFEPMDLLRVVEEILDELSRHIDQPDPDETRLRDVDPLTKVRVNLDSKSNPTPSQDLEKETLRKFDWKKWGIGFDGQKWWVFKAKNDGKRLNWHDYGVAEIPKGQPGQLLHGFLDRGGSLSNEEAINVFVPTKFGKNRGQLKKLVKDEMGKLTKSIKNTISQIVRDKEKFDIGRPFETDKSTTRRCLFSIGSAEKNPDSKKLEFTPVDLSNRE